MFSAIWSPPKASETCDLANPKTNPLNPQGLKPCCACPDTKSARDACFLQNGAENSQCVELVKKHVECMRALGFEI